jgi:hypothetical protein
MTHENAKQPGYPLTVYPEDLARIRTKSGRVNMADVRKVVGAKAMRIVLMRYHSVPDAHVAKVLENVKVVRVTFREDTPKHWGQLIELLYCFKDRKSNESYRHVFHFVPDGDGLSGRVYTHARKYIAR